MLMSDEAETQLKKMNYGLIKVCCGRGALPLSTQNNVGSQLPRLARGQPASPTLTLRQSGGRRQGTWRVQMEQERRQVVKFRVWASTGAHRCISFIGVERRVSGDGAAG